VFILITPVVGWAGGKKRLIPEISKRVPEYKTYYEPFLGGGSVLFYLQPNKAFVNDCNWDLINMYNVVKNDVDSLIEDLKKHKNERQYYYTIRALDRDYFKFRALNAVQRASRFFYLNQACYRNVYRVNARGEFNTAFGDDEKANLIKEPVLRVASLYFNTADIRFSCNDFEESVKTAKKGDFVYLDPPYDPLSKTANFTTYTKNGFGRWDQMRLKETCDLLNKKQVKFLLSNSATDFIKDLYKDYVIETVQAPRQLDCRVKTVSKVDELLIKNYA